MFAILVLGLIGALGAVGLYILARKFHVYEDPRIAQFEALLPGANCGACGRKGCHDAAVDCVTKGSIEGFFCPSAGNEGMAHLAEFMGGEAEVREPDIAIVRCVGTHQTKTRLEARYVGPASCALMNGFVGEYACLQSCLGCGDCVAACPFGAITIPDNSDNPVVDATKCTGCGKCAAACPRHIIEIRSRGIKNRRVWVACSNCAKGAITRKQCTVGCIGCGLCKKECPFGAITITNNLAHIDATICKSCGKCISVCPTKAIHSVNIQVRPKAPAQPKAEAAPQPKPQAPATAPTTENN